MDQIDRECRNRRYRESRGKRTNRYSDDNDRDRDRSRDRERERDRDRDRDRERDREDRDRNHDWYERRRWNKDEWRDTKEKDRKWDYKEDEEREYSKDYRDHKEYSPEISNKSYSYKEPKSHSKKDYDENWEKKYPDDDSSDSYGSTEPTKNTTFNSSETRMNLDGDIYKNQTPNNTLMIRGLAQHITENDIRQDILLCGLMPKDIRLIRKKDTGASRGFAFVEFNTIQEASRWMEMKKGVLMLQDQYRAILHYSIPKENYIERSNIKPIQDWYCVKCGAHNFKRRDSCFKCHASRQVSEEGGEGSDEISVHPTKVLLIRSLDILTTEDSVKHTLSNYTLTVPKSIRIGQDPLTNTSRGICYVEFNSVLDAMTLTNAIAEKPLIVDGRKLLVSYCKTECPTPQWKQLPNGEMGNRFTAEDIPRLSEYSASLYATTIPQLQSYQQYYETYFRTQLAQGAVITLPTQHQGESINPAAASLAQTAIQQAHSAKEASESQMNLFKKNNTNVGKSNSQSNVYIPSNNIPQSSNTTVPYATQPTGLPDVSTYQYDEASGYYYDADTGLYYDANSQYYYNPQTQQFLYWDSEKQSYIPATSEMSSNNTKDENKKGKEKGERHDKVKVAKKIAKDMEKWAKTLNQKKDNARMNIIQSTISQAFSKSLGAADAGYAVLERKEIQNSLNDSNIGQIDNDTATIGNISPRQASLSSGLVAAYGGGSESEEDIEDVLQEDKQHTNWIKLACLLCKRQFPSKESLIRHQQLSVLHNQNLEEWYKVRGLDPNDPQQRNKKYRDRAKERRQKFGEPNPTHPNRLKEKYLKAREDAVSTSYEEPTKIGIGSDNVGNKLLQKMGWQEGMGLGKTNQGRTTIIQAKQKVNTAGLGIKGGCYEPLPGETYKDCVKKMMFARYHELTEQEQGLPNS